MELAQELRTDGAVRLILSGDVDMSSAPQLRLAGERAAQEPGSTAVVVDLADVTFLDSSGIGALVAVRSAALGAGCTMRVVNPSDRVRQVIDVCGLGTDFGL